MTRTILVAALLTLVTACGSSADSDPPSRSPSRTSPPTTTPASSERASRDLPLPAIRVVPSGDGRINTKLYLALGDSLSGGVGASVYHEKGFVPLIHDALGPDFALLNLGIAGHTSTELIQEGPLERAIGEIEERNHDDNPDNNVEFVTLEIGGNDLLDIFFDYVLPGRCPSVAVGLERPDCVDQLRRALDGYEPNLDQILDRLREVDPDLEIFLMTLYNPFSAGTPEHDELAELALEGRADTPFPEGLQDIIRRQAEANDVHLVEIYPHFAGKANELIALDRIHPNDAGYRVMADVVLAGMREAGTID
jgi:lysophospholipase L1-like esterase